MCDKAKTNLSSPKTQDPLYEGALVGTLAYEKQSNPKQERTPQAAAQGFSQGIGFLEVAADVPRSVENKVLTMLEDAELRIQNTQRELNRLYEVRTRLIQQGVSRLPRDYFSFYDF
jgi:hypothetical protein